MNTLKHFIDGEFVNSSNNEINPVINPANGNELCLAPVGDRADTTRAIDAATEAFNKWRDIPAVDRARMLFRYKQLLDGSSGELAKIVTQEHGKALHESIGSVKRGIENIEHACGIPSLLLGDSLEDIADGIDTSTFRQPLGVFAAITPYNFPAMIPMWFWPYALMSGNTFILKPSEKVPLSTDFQMRLIKEAGFPSGVINTVYGKEDVSNALIEDPRIQGISFVGSTRVAKAIYEKSAKEGKRVQAFGGAKNHFVIMPDCAPSATIDSLIDSAFGCAGQRCLAASVAIFVGNSYDQLIPALIEKSKNLRIGDGLDPNTQLGPVNSRAQLSRIENLISQGEKEGAHLILDGRKVTLREKTKGNFIGASIFTHATPEMSIMTEEIFGPVLCVQQANNLDDALEIIRGNPMGNAATIYTNSGASARRFKREVGISMIGINIGVAAPMSFFPFGGSKQSFFGDTKAHGKEAVRFFTDSRVVISRWF